MCLLQGAAVQMKSMYCPCRVQAGSALQECSLQARGVLDARRTNRATMYVTCASLTLQLQAVQAHATYYETSR